MWGHVLPEGAWWDPGKASGGKKRLCSSSQQNSYSFPEERREEIVGFPWLLLGSGQISPGLAPSCQSRATGYGYAGVMLLETTRPQEWVELILPLPRVGFL